MIKIAVVSLGQNRYAAFSLNQEYPLATILHTRGYESRDELERIMIVRFHSQRNEYKKLGIELSSVREAGTRRGGWKFIWTNTSVFWNKVEPQTKVETIVNEPGLTIKKEVPLQEVADLTAKKLEQMYFAKALLTGGFEFTPVTDDIICESDIPMYMKLYKKD